MIEGLVSGRVWSAAERRLDKTGKTFCVAKLRVVNADADGLLVNLIAFDQCVCDSLFQLREGDAVAVSGALTPKVWLDKQGNAKPALDMVAHRILALAAPDPSLG
jgi:single-stranded DNA-binding protein